MGFKGLISFLHNPMFLKYSKPATKKIRVFYALFTYASVSQNRCWCNQGKRRQKNLKILNIRLKLQQIKSKAKHWGCEELTYSRDRAWRKSQACQNKNKHSNITKPDFLVRILNDKSEWAPDSHFRCS
jgi:hypothetical protein